ncbi:hypothetical protein ASPZODRAFT_167023 [Penicilliopsis zonata CBS 506.65]|uniref:Thioredoxin-like fold domain-containing protein n=1 Tax=Penicilliopsis zonata CBS 506.65 TaxID=1073090 RepID=A0A1L9SFI7_9EURO|nr:hypothetical protein ASPZODRAFT_167023 [Penicilliopsis zonata CBS 506.65]OJJ45990.1 hypothetical protein ASPZODRAFT_167023 [Penicilliopsis zonata CBS 506.65]
MAVPASVAYTALGEGPATAEFWLDLLCPFSQKCTALLHSYLVPAVLPGGKYHGKLRILIRPYPQPWHPQGGYSCLSLWSFGRAFCAPGNAYGGDARLWFEYYAAVAAKLDDFKDGQALGVTGHEYNKKLVDIGAEAVWGSVDKLGLKNIDSLEAARAIFANALEPAISAKGNNDNPNGPDMKYFIRLGRQNSINATLSLVWDGLYDRIPQSSWKEAEWDEYLRYFSSPPETCA